MISKSLIDVGVVLDSGATEDWRGEIGAEVDDVGLRSGLAIECRRFERRDDSRASILGDIGGVTSSLGSSGLRTGFCVLIVKALEVSSSKLRGGGVSLGDDGATIGAARARGEETDEGVDDRVCII